MDFCIIAESKSRISPIHRKVRVSSLQKKLLKRKENPKNDKEELKMEHNQC